MLSRTGIMQAVAFLTRPLRGGYGYLRLMRTAYIRERERMLSRSGIMQAVPFLTRSLRDGYDILRLMRTDYIRGRERHAYLRVQVRQLRHLRALAEHQRRSARSLSHVRQACHPPDQQQREHHF